MYCQALKGTFLAPDVTFFVHLFCALVFPGGLFSVGIDLATEAIRVPM